MHNTEVQQNTGARRMSLKMFAMVDRANQFTGVPRGTAKPLQFLGAFQEAEPYLSLPSRAFKLVSWLVKKTQVQDWEEGSRPIAWPSARLQQEFLGLSAAGVKALNRALFEAGIFVLRDNEQGKRHGRRDLDGRIIEAFGFDLSPLAQRYDEFVGLAAEAAAERKRMKQERTRVTVARRAIREIGNQLAEHDSLSGEWARLEANAAALVRAAKQAKQSDKLAPVADSLERGKAEAITLFKEAVARASKPVETSPVELANEPQTISTNLTIHLTDTVIARDGGSRAEAAVPPASLPVRRLTPEYDFKVKPAQLLDLAPARCSARAHWSSGRSKPGPASGTSVGSCRTAPMTTAWKGW